MKKKTLFCITACVLSAGMLTGCQVAGTDIVLTTHSVNNDTFFSVNDTFCNIKEGKIYYSNYKNIYGNAYGVDLWDYDFGSESLQQYVKDVTVEELTRIYCMDLVAKEQGIELSEEDEEKVDSAAKEYYNSLTSSEKDYIGVSKGDVVDAYMNYALAEKLYFTMTEGVDTEVSDDDARVISVLQIVVSDSSKADAIKRKLAKGEDFETIAGQYTEAEEIKLNVARGDLPKEVEDVAFELNNGGVTGAIETEQGIYFIKCLNKFEHELTEANKGVIQVKREKEQFEDKYNYFVENAKFVLNEEIWNSVKIRTEDGVNTSSFFEIYKKYFK